jgi:phosphatidylinositol alpha-mannosyltransferase
VARLFRAEPFDIVHVHEPLTPILPWFAVWFASAPVVATFHVHREQGHWLYALSRPLLAPLARKLRICIAVSEPAHRTVAEHFPGSYEIIPNGIELARFRTVVPRPPEMPPAGRWVLSVGRLEPRKGLHQLIRAMALVRRRIPDAGLVIVGDGSDRRALEHAARDGAAPVHFAGAVADEALPAYYQAADLICAPALGGESFGIVLLEAMACAKPVVASRIDGYAALTGDTEAVRLVPPGDIDAMGAALTELLLHDVRRVELGAVALEFARRYDWELLARRLESVYDRARQTARAARSTQ